MKIDLKMGVNLTIAFCLVGLITIVAQAATTNAIEDVMCNVVNMLTGTVGKAIATIGIVVLGIGLFMGKLSWTLALATGIGIALIFGAAGIVNWLGATQGADTMCPTP